MRYIIAALVFGFGGLSISAQGANLYVTDVLHVPIRSGSSSGHKVLASLKSGDKLVVVDDDEENGYIEVKTKKGIVGWVPSRYLVDKPIAASRLAWYQAQVAKAKSS